MSNELIIPGNDNSTDLDVFDAMSNIGDSYLPRLQLFSGKSDACTEGLIPINHYGLVDGDDIIDLGPEIIVAVLAARHKAMCTDGDVQSSHDPNSDLFKDFVVRSGIKNSGCMYGPEFLVFIPSVARYATYFMGSKTARRESKKFKPLMSKPAKLISKPVEKGKYKWLAPVILPSDEVVDLPDMEKAQAEVERFRNPPKDTVEVAPEDNRER